MANTYVVRGEQPQNGAMGWGTEWQSEEMADLQVARKAAKQDVADGHFNVRIHKVEGNNGANYPLVEKISE